MGVVATHRGHDITLNSRGHFEALVKDRLISKATLSGLRMYIDATCGGNEAVLVFPGSRIPVFCRVHIMGKRKGDLFVTKEHGRMPASQLYKIDEQKMAHMQRIEDSIITLFDAWNNILDSMTHFTGEEESA